MDADHFKHHFKLPQAEPLMAKAKEIHVLVQHILDAAPETGEDTSGGSLDEDAQRKEYGRDALKLQMEDMHMASILIPAQIVGAEAADLYDIRMENAALIRRSARGLVVGLHGLGIFGYNEQPYFNLLRDEIEEFRKLFVAWVEAFDKEKFIWDEWGLFNPAGAKPGDGQFGDLDDDDDDDIDYDDIFSDDDEDGGPF